SLDLITQSPAQAIEKLERISAQLFLAGRHSFVAVLPLLRRVFFALANQLVGRGNQILLPARERVLILIASLPATTSALLLRLAILHLERFYLDEIYVAGCFAAGVAGFRVIGNEVPRLQIELFEKEGMGPDQRTSRLAR